MKTLLALTTTVLSLAVLTGCKKETYGDPMKFAKKYLLEEMMSPGFKTPGLSRDTSGYATETPKYISKDLPLKDFMKMQGYTGFEILNARLASNHVGEEVVECTVTIHTSGKYKYYTKSEKTLTASKINIQGSQYSNIVPTSAILKRSEWDEKWVTHLLNIEKEYPRVYEPIPTPLPFKASVIRRSVDGVYVPVISFTQREKNSSCGMWNFSNTESFEIPFVVTDMQIMKEPLWVINGTAEQIQAYNTYSQRVIQAKLLGVEKSKVSKEFTRIDHLLNGWGSIRRVEGEERVKLEKEQKEVIQSLEEIKKRILAL